MWSLWVLYMCESDQNFSQITSWYVLVLCLAFALNYGFWRVLEDNKLLLVLATQKHNRNTVSNLLLLGRFGLPGRAAVAMPPPFSGLKCWGLGCSSIPLPRSSQGLPLCLFAPGCWVRAPPNHAVPRAGVTLWQLTRVSLHHFQGQRAAVLSPDSSYSSQRQNRG